MKIVMQGGPFHGQELDVDSRSHFIKFPQANVTMHRWDDDFKHHSWDEDALTITEVEYQRTDRTKAGAVVFIPNHANVSSESNV